MAGRVRAAERQLAAALALALLAQAAPAADWEPTLAERALGGVRETRWALARPPGGPHDRIQVHRYRAAEPARAVLLYLPGTWMNGHAAVTDPRHNLWLHLAEEGVEVWALDYRTHFVPPEPGDHGFMKEWTLARFVDDARAAADLARRESGHAQIFVAGFSRGVTLAFGFACVEDPAGVAGLVVLDGRFKSATPSDFDLARERDALFAKGRVADDVAFRIGWEKRSRLMSAAADDPDGPAKSAGFESVGAEVTQLLYNAWGPGALADPLHDVSRVEVLARLLAGYDRYWPSLQNVEGRSIASRADDPNTAIDDAWGELALPILYFGAGNLGADWALDGIHSVVKSGSDDVSLHLLEGYGHLDVLVGERAHEDVYAPLTRWILDRSPDPSPTHAE